MNKKLVVLEGEFTVISQRELAVARLAGKGYNNKEIGQALKISDRTVQVDLHTIFKKLKVSDRTQMVILLLHLGKLTLNELVEPATIDSTMNKANGD
jgi:DNA-binding NarL/FixJ family response regulator